MRVSPSYLLKKDCVDAQLVALAHAPLSGELEDKFWLKKDEEPDELWVKYYRASAGLIWRKLPAVK